MWLTRWDGCGVHRGDPICSTRQGLLKRVSKASIMASLEPVVASLSHGCISGADEQLTAAGIVGVLGGVVIWVKV